MMESKIRFAGDPNCEICKGLGYEPTAFRGTRRKCVCLLKKEVPIYLTPVYANAKYIDTFQVDSVVNKDILMMSCPQPQFKSFFKSFLLNTGMKYSHQTVFAHDVMQAYLSRDDENAYTALSRFDILVIFLVIDPPNKAYAQILISLLEKRAMHGRVSWIFSQNELKSEKFQNLYSSEFAEFVESKFIRLKAPNAS